MRSTRKWRSDATAWLGVAVPRLSDRAVTEAACSRTARAGEQSRGFPFQHPNVKLFRALSQSMLDVVPDDPTRDAADLAYSLGVRWPRRQRPIVVSSGDWAYPFRASLMICPAHEITDRPSGSPGTGRPQCDHLDLDALRTHEHRPLCFDPKVICGSLLCSLHVDLVEYPLLGAYPKHDLPFRKSNAAVMSSGQI